jgi:hypothetical protein
VVVDAFDVAALCDAMARARPSIFIHQLTDLSLEPNGQSDSPQCAPS